MPLLWRYILLKYLILDIDLLNEVFTVIISDASVETLFPEEDFHKDPFDKDFVVVDYTKSQTKPTNLQSRMSDDTKAVVRDPTTQRGH